MELQNLLVQIEQIQTDGDAMIMLKVLRTCRDALNCCQLFPACEVDKVLLSLLEVSMSDQMCWSLKVLSGQVVWLILTKMPSNRANETMELLQLNAQDHCEYSSLLELTVVLRNFVNDDWISQLTRLQQLLNDWEFFLKSQPLIIGFLLLVDLKSNELRRRFIVDLGDILLTEAVKWRPQDSFPIITSLRTMVDRLLNVSDLKGNAEEKLLLQRWDSKMSEMVQSHWESVFSGTAESTVQLYGSWVKLKAPGAILAELLSCLHDCVWYDKGHFSAITVLIEQISTEEINGVKEELFERILAGVSNNSLASGAACCYKAVLAKCSVKLSYPCDINVGFLAHFLEKCLLHTESETNRLTIKYLLSPTAKLMPEVMSLLIQILSQRLADMPLAKDFVEYAWNVIDAKQLTCIEATVASLGEEVVSDGQWIEREKLLFCIATVYTFSTDQRLPVDPDILKESLYARHYQSRIAGFKNLCNTVDSKCLCDPTQWETTSSQIIGFLTANLSVDDSEFRKQLGRTFAGLMNVFATILSKNKPKKKPILNNHSSVMPGPTTPIKDFLLRLHDVFLRNLFLGANYQRLCSCFTLLHSFSQMPTLITLINLPARSSWSQDIAIIADFILHSSQEIRQKAMDIVVSLSGTDKLLGVQLVKRLVLSGLTMCNSAKEMICETGTDVITFLLKRLDLKSRCSVQISFDPRHCSFAVNLPEATTNGNKWDFHLWLVEHIGKSVDRLIEDFGKGSQREPTHGFLKLLAAVLTPSTVEPIMLHKIMVLCQRLLAVVFKTVGSSDSELNPSFEVMHERLEQQAASLEIPADDDENIFIPLGLQYVLACCWLNIQDLCHVLLSVARCSNEFPVFTEIGDMYFSMLLRLRHTGALDACHADFNSFCKICVGHSDSNIVNIPRKIAYQTLSMVVTSDRISITRRSIGMPMILQAVLEAYHQRKDEQLLHQVISQLSCVVREAQLSDCVDEKSDLPSVRAVNCLRSLARSTALGSVMIQYVPLLFEFSLKNLNSSVWAIRNAAVLLFAAICGRMFGPRQMLIAVHPTRKVLEQKVSLLSFASLHYLVWTQCCEVLADCANGQRSSSFDLRLHPVLTILGRLFVSKQHSTIMSDQLRSDLLSASKNLQLLAALTPVANLKKMISQCHENLFGTPLSCGSTEELLSGHYCCQLALPSADFASLSAVPALNSFLLNFYGSFKSVAKIECRCDLGIHTCIWPKLLSCGQNAYGFSVRSLALPVMTAVVLKRMAFSPVSEMSREMLASWVDCVENCVDEKMSENCRIAASQSFALCGIGFLRSFPDDLIGGSVKLFFAALSLARDEVAEVRLPMGLAFRDVSCGFNSGCHCGNFECLGQWGSHVWSTSTSFVEELLRRIAIDSSELQSDIDERSLFSQKGFNVFRESWLDVLFCYKCLQTCVISATVWSRLMTKARLIQLTNAAVKAHQRASQSHSSDILSVATLKLVISLKLSKDSGSSDLLKKISSVLNLTLLNQINRVTEESE